MNMPVFCFIDILQKNVREHANKMLGRTRNDNVQLACEETVLRYKSTSNEEDGPLVVLFRPDFSESIPEKSPWNIRLAEIFVNDYTKRGLPYDQLKDIHKYFLTYLQTLQTTHRKMATSSTSGKGTVYKEASRRNRIRKRRISVRLLSLLLYDYTNVFDQINSGTKNN